MFVLKSVKYEYIYPPEVVDRDSEPQLQVGEQLNWIPSSDF